MAATQPRQEMPDATFEEWDRRIEHRYNGLAHIYGSPDYATCWRYGAAGCRRCLVGSLLGWNHQRCKSVQVAGCDCRHVQVAPAGNFPGSVAGFRMHGFVTDCFFCRCWKTSIHRLFRHGGPYVGSKPCCQNVEKKLGRGYERMAQ